MAGDYTVKMQSQTCFVIILYFLVFTTVITTCAAEQPGAGHVFALAEKSGGAAGYLRSMQLHISQDALERLTSVLADPTGGGAGGMAALAALLDADPDLVRTLLARVLPAVYTAVRAQTIFVLLQCVKYGTPMR